jgi:3-hydroxyisobutyrate dehydrogenase-like beta-hydroxyacid dehydrogenase
VTSNPGTVGIIGLGIMGIAYARNLIAGGFEVVGFDPSPAAQDALRIAGGGVFATPRDVSRASDAIIVALASVPALEAVTEGIVAGLRPATVVIEMGTLPIEAKDCARVAVEAAGGHFLDCPVSGTGAQAVMRDLVVFASGDGGAIQAARPVLEAVARDVREVGPFGAGMKLKYVANLLVAIHNIAAAEALLLAERSGLDPAMALDALRGGAGGSRMLDVRGPLMVAESFEPATMKLEVFQKDLALIADYARAVGAAVPLFQASLAVYDAAMEEGRAKQDTASVFGVLKNSQS